MKQSKNYMISNIRHTGLVVRNLQKSYKFYNSLGFKKIKQDAEEGHFIETVTGIKNVKISWIKMSAGDGSLIELIQKISLVFEYYFPYHHQLLIIQKRIF